MANDDDERYYRNEYQLIDSDSQEPEIEAIEEIKGTGRGTLYKVKWIGKDERTWEPSANWGGNIDHLLKEYHNVGEN